MVFEVAFDIEVEFVIEVELIVVEALLIMTAPNMASGSSQLTRATKGMLDVVSFAASPTV